MSFNKQYEYENELFIDSKLLCAIYLNPFIKPKRTSCKHLFCHSCIQTWFEKDASCPLCRQLLPRKHLKSVTNENILYKLDQLHVKCLLCQETKIHRKDFDYHIDNQCPKVIVSCSTNNNKCSWRGQREDLQSHLKTDDCHQVKEKKFKLNFHILKIKKIISQSSFNSQICLRELNITDDDIPIVVQYAIKNKHCQILDLGHNQIDSHGILLLAESLQNNTTLKVLSFHQNSLSETSILYLAEKISFKNSALKWLDLESTNLTDNNAEYLAIMLITNKSLTGLWLSKNQIGYHVGVKTLTSALIYYNTTLKYLDLENNLSINDSSFSYLMEMSEQNQSLNIVYVNNCQLSTMGRMKLWDMASTKSNFRLFL